jgi:hypothetical protein
MSHTNKGIYSLTFPDDSMYIGLSSDLATRIKTHITSMISGKSHNIQVQKAFNKYGLPNIKIEEYVAAGVDLEKLETKYINAAVKAGIDLLNISKMPPALKPKDPQPQQADAEGIEMLQLRVKELEDKYQELEELLDKYQELEELLEWYRGKLRAEEKQREERVISGTAGTSFNSIKFGK